MFSSVPEPQTESRKQSTDTKDKASTSDHIINHLLHCLLSSFCHQTHSFMSCAAIFKTLRQANCPSAPVSGLLFSLLLMMCCFKSLCVLEESHIDTTSWKLGSLRGGSSPIKSPTLLLSFLGLCPESACSGGAWTRRQWFLLCCIEAARWHGVCDPKAWKTIQKGTFLRALEKRNQNLIRIKRDGNQR